jgi:hypothetical protein
MLSVYYNSAKASHLLNSAIFYYTYIYISYYSIYYYLIIKLIGAILYIEYITILGIIVLERITC